MRILTLDLEAFGPFTRRRVDFGSSGELGGLHVIHGPNEVGKSSALRALEAALFGVPVRTTDNFIHDYEKLRVGARLRRDDGSEIAFRRRKGSKNTLLGSGRDEALEDDALEPFLGGVSREVFRSVFGIDHEALVSGGRDLLEERGEIGRALFAAGAGTRGLRRVLKELEEEAEELFLPRGSKPAINRTLAAYREAGQEVRRASLSERDWEEHARALEGLETGLEESAGERRDLARELEALRRLSRILPKLGERSRLRAAVEKGGDLENALLLAEDFGERRRKAVERSAAAGEARRRALGRLEELEERLEGIPDGAALLELAEPIEGLHQRLEAYRRDQERLPRLGAELKGLRSQVAIVLRRLRPGDSGVDGPAGGTPPIEHGLPDPSGLRSAVDGARSGGDFDRELARLRAELDATGSGAEDDLRSLAPWGGEAEELGALPLPPAETLDQFEGRMREVDDRIGRDEEGRDRNRAQARLVARHLREMLEAGEVPAEQDLVKARARREQLWRELVKSLRTGVESTDSKTASYEDAVRDADAIADRLRREADRVLKRASLEAEASELEEELAEIERRSHRLRGLRERVRGEWRELWKDWGFEPRTPKEMRGWVSRAGEVSSRAAERRRLEARIEELQLARNEHRLAIEVALEPLPEVRLPEGPDLKPLIESGARALADLEEAHSKIEEAKSLESEAAGLGRELETFEAEARSVDESAGEGGDGERSLADLPVGELVSRLYFRLTEGRRAQTEREALLEERRRRKIEISDANAGLEAMEERLGELRREAGCESDEGLEVAEDRSARLRALRSKVDLLESELLDLGQGTSLADLEGQAAVADPDTLPLRLAELEEKLAEIDERREELLTDKGKEQSELRRMDGTAAAADAAERRQDVAARLRREVGSYLRLRLATLVLHQEIERYRSENQAPILARAGDLFARLTAGSLTGLAASFDGADRSILLGMRPDGEPLTVEGMSSGTRDQLYLALRVATLERYLERAETMPLIVDDILINFDDQRSAAALEVLAELGEKTQVLLFTHHSRIVEQASVIPAGVFLHRLDGNLAESGFDSDSQGAPHAGEDSADVRSGQENLF